MIGNLAAGTVLLAVLLNGLGLLTVNAYLSRMGMSDFGLVRGRYVATGLLVVLYIALAFMSPSFAAYYIATAEAELPDKLPIAAMVAVFPALGFFAYFVPNVGLLAALGSYVLGFFTGVSAALVYVVAVHGQSTAENATGLLGFVEEYGFSKLLVVYFFGLFLLLCFLAFLGMFARRLYPKIPEHLGGAKPKKARLLVSFEAVDAAKSLGVSVPDVSASTPGQLSEPVLMLFEGTNDYALELSDERRIRISKELVVGIEVL